MAINVQTIQGEWTSLCGLARQRWSQLTEDDFGAVQGNIEQLVGRIQQKTGEGREAIEKFFSDATSRGSTAVANAAESAGEYAQQVSARLRERYDNAESLVRHHPTETVIAAFGIGLVAGLIAGLAIRGRVERRGANHPHRNAAVANQRKSPMDHPVVVTFLILAVIAAMSLAAEVLKPLALAVLLSFALAPLAGFFERFRVPRAIAVLLTVALALGSLVGIGYVVVRQLAMLAYQLPSYQERIQKKVDFLLKPSDDTAFHRAEKVAGDVAKSLDKPVIAGHEAMDVRVIEEPTFRQRLQGAVGPYLEFVGVGSFVLILVLFMLMNREALGDRVVQLFGQPRSISRPGPWRRSASESAVTWR